MISETDKKIIVEYAKKYNVTTIILFGSSLEKDDTHDIDLGVKGIKPELFFKFYGELSRNVSKEVDLVDLADKCLFTDLIQERGVTIYG